jgi:hypothetical protein
LVTSGGACVPVRRTTARTERARESTDGCVRHRGGQTVNVFNPSFVFRHRPPFSLFACPRVPIPCDQQKLRVDTSSSFCRMRYKRSTLSATQTAMSARGRSPEEKTRCVRAVIRRVGAVHRAQTPRWAQNPRIVRLLLAQSNWASTLSGAESPLTLLQSIVPYAHRFCGPQPAWSALDTLVVTVRESKFVLLPIAEDPHG